MSKVIVVDNVKYIVVFYYDDDGNERELTRYPL